MFLKKIVNMLFGFSPRQLAAMSTYTLADVKNIDKSDIIFKALLGIQIAACSVLPILVPDGWMKFLLLVTAILGAHFLTQSISLACKREQAKEEYEKRPNFGDSDISQNF